MHFSAERGANVITGVRVIATTFVLGYRGTLDSMTSGRGRVQIRLSNAAIDFAQARRTLVIVVQEGCSYCTKSMPFYRSLISQGDRPAASLRVVVAAPLAESGTESYLRSHGVEPDAVVHLDRTEMPARLTPTLLLADSDGDVVATWEGFLTLEDEHAVREVLFQGQ